MKNQVVGNEEVTYVNIEQGDLPESGSTKECEILEEALIPKTNSDACLLDLVPEEEARSEDDSDASTLSGFSTDFQIAKGPTSGYGVIGQIIVPFILAGIGTVGAGLLLDSFVKGSSVFHDIPEIIILVPVILGVKGNIEMTLASRLSTAANKGKLDTFGSATKLVVANLALVQVQAFVVGLLASFVAALIGGVLNKEEGLLLGAASVLTTSLASFGLGTLMALVICVARLLKLDPDNIATPIAASVGDLATLAILEFSAREIYREMGNVGSWIAIAIISACLVVNTVFWCLALLNKSTKKVLSAPSSWASIIGGMFLTCAAGKIFDHSVKMFKNIAVFQPTMNGVGGNLVAVQASKIATYLHCHNTFGSLPADITKIFPTPIRAFYNGVHAKTAWALLTLLIPGHIMFSTAIALLHQEIGITVTFLGFYLMAAIVQVLILLYLADVMVHFFWSHKIDPDNVVIPCLTSIGDLLGTALLVVAFQLIFLVQGGEENEGLMAYLNSK